MTICFTSHKISATVGARGPCSMSTGEQPGRSHVLETGSGARLRGTMSHSLVEDGGLGSGLERSH